MEGVAATNENSDNRLQQDLNGILEVVELAAGAEDALVPKENAEAGTAVADPLVAAAGVPNDRPPEEVAAALPGNPREGPPVLTGADVAEAAGATVPKEKPGAGVVDAGVLEEPVCAVDGAGVAPKLNDPDGALVAVVLLG